MIRNKYIPCAYVYMSGKYEEADYDRVFAALKKIGIEHSSDGKGFNPTYPLSSLDITADEPFINFSYNTVASQNLFWHA